MANGKDFNFIDMSGKFQEIPQNGYLLQDLAIFQTVPHDNINVSADRLDDSQSELTQAVARASMDMSPIHIPRAANYILPTVLRHTVSTVTTSDWQGKRAVGEDRPMTANDVVFNQMRKHQQQAHDDRERVLAQVLFANTVNREYGESTIDYQEFWDADQNGNQMTQGTFTLDAGPTGYALASLEKAKTQLKSKMGGWRNRVSGYYMFCSASVFYGIMSSPDVMQAVLYSKIGTDAMFPASLSGYDNFRIGNVTVILDDSEFHADYVSDGAAYLVPRFSGVVEGSIAPFTMFNCPASHNQKVAEGPAYGTFFYVFDDAYFNKSVNCESSYLPVQFRPDWVLRVDYSA